MEIKRVLRKKRNRFTALSIAVIILIGSLTGCTVSSGEENDGSPVRISMIWWGNDVRNSRTQRVLELYHKQNENVIIEGKSYPSTDYWKKMEFHAAGKTMPDLVQMEYSKLNSYVEKGILLDLTPYIESGELDVGNIPEEVLNTGKSEGGIYGIPAGLNAYCLFYNKTVTDECGIVIRDNMTFDEFVEVAKEITEKTGYRANLCPIDGYTFINQWSRAEGIAVTGADVPVESAEEYIPFFQILEQGIKDGWHIRPDYGDMTAVETDPLVYGSIPRTMAWCTVHGGSNLLSAFQAAAPNGVEIGITTIPTDSPEKSNYVNPAMFFSVSADTEYPEEAVAVLDYLINSEEANNILLGERGVPVSTAVAERIADKLPRAERASMDFLNQVIIPCSSPIDLPAPEGAIELASTLEEILEAVSTGDCTAEEAAEIYYQEEVRLWGKRTDER